MAALQYLDFELQVDRAGDGFRAEVLRSPVGEAAVSFTLPFTDEGLENLILKIGTSRGRRRSVFSSEVAAARELGSRLFDAVFAGDVRACLRSSLEKAESQPGTGLRLKLRLQSVGELADLPWEFLYDPSLGRFLAQSTFTPLVRYIEMPQRIRPLALDLPLHVLVMISSPDDPEYEKLDVEHEKARVRDALEPLQSAGKLHIDWLETATLAELRNALRTNVYHAFHFIGHGGFDPAAQEGVLILEDEQRRGLRAGAHRIGPLLHDHRSLRMAVFNACEGARNSREDVFSGIATGLIRHGVPAVVAMQFEITDRAAITFAHGFYSAIASGYPVDMAVAEARTAILVQPNDIEWATPVLYMRSADGNLFDVKTVDRVSDGAAEARGEAAAVAEGVTVADEALIAPITLSLSQGGGRFQRLLNGAGDYSLTLRNPGTASQEVQLNTHISASGYHSSLPTSISLPPGEKSLRFSIMPARRRWRGERVPVPFFISAGGSGGLPPAIVEGRYDDRPEGWQPFAAGAVLGLGGLALASALLLSGGSTTDEQTETIFFSSNRGGGAHDIYAMGPYGSLVRKITTDPGNDFQPSATRDGTRIAFVSNRDDRDEVYVMNGNGLEQLRITNDTYTKLQPDISPDGRRVAYQRKLSDTHFDVYFATLDGTATYMPGSRGSNIDAAWSPDGRRVAFASDREGSYDIYVMDLDGGNLRRLTSDVGVNQAPSWSPGGTRIAFQSTRDGNPEIYVMNADGSDQRRVTFHAGNDQEPSFSPDGLYVAFETDRDGNWEIYVASIDGSYAYNVTNHPAEDRKPSWTQSQLR